jgi:hypothetical protein
MNGKITRKDVDQWKSELDRKFEEKAVAKLKELVAAEKIKTGSYVECDDCKKVVDILERNGHVEVGLLRFGYEHQKDGGGGYICFN